MNELRKSSTLWLLAALIALCALAIDWRREARAAEAAGPARGASLAEPVSPHAQPPEPVARELRVLFIGNSLTSSELPAMIAELARAAGESRRFVPTVELKGGASLADHLEAGRVQAQIAHKGPWHAVVLQEHGGYAAALPLQDHTVNSARALQRLVQAAGAQPLLFVPFARRGGYSAGDTYESMQARVSDNIATLGRTLGVDAVPIGTIWSSVLRSRPSLQLWDERGMHPSRAGTYLAACAFYARFYRASPAGSAYTAGLELEDARVIQSTVASTLIAD